MDEPEVLDEGGCDEAEARRSLDDLRRLNRWWFGTSMIEWPLTAWLRESPKPATVLDLGTGSGQLAQALACWAAQEYQAVRVVALDFTPRHLRYARVWNARAATPHVHLVGGNALRLPLADRSVDYVTSSLFLHHFDEAALLALFAECRRVARRGLLMSDLWRHPLPTYLYKSTLGPLLTRSPVTHADSDTSFRRAYTLGEMRAIAARVLPNVDITLHVPGLRWLLASRWDE